MVSNMIYFLTVGVMERSEDEGPKGFQHKGSRCRRVTSAAGKRLEGGGDT